MIAKNKEEGLHKMPSDLRKVINSKPEVLKIWKTLTPLARNEWICWVTSVKKIETRNKKLERVYEDLMNGKRRPCCWPGCIHRKDKPMNSSQKFLKAKGQLK